jgi:tetratricopeptide (TPR) repeat protein
MRPTLLASIIAVFVICVPACAAGNGSALADALARGDALFEAANNEKEMEAAIAAYQQALGIDPESTPALLGLGRAYADTMMVRFYYAPRDEAGALEAGERAAEALLRAIDLEPGLIDAYAVLSDVYRPPGRYAETVSLLERGLARNPDDVELLTLLGRALFDLGRPGEAQRPLRRAHALGAVPLTYRYLGWSDFHLGRFSDQLAWFEEFVSSEPLNDQGQGGVVLSYVGLRDFDSAISYAEKLVDENAGHRLFHRFLSKAGEAHLFAGNEEQAISFYERALSIDPMSRNQYSVRLASTTLGYLIAQAGRDEEAKVLLNRTIEDTEARIASGDERWEHRYDLASAYAALNDRDAAIEWLGIAVEAGLPAPTFVSMDPLWAEFRDEPDFQILLERVEDRIAEQRRIAESPWVD